MKQKLVIFIFILFVTFLTACNNPFTPIDSEITKVTLSTGIYLLNPASRGVADNVTSFRLTVTAEGISAIEQSFTEESFSLDVEAGLARTFTLQALDADENTLFSGSTTVDLTAGESVNLSIEMDYAGFYVSFDSSGGSTVISQFINVGGLLATPALPSSSGFTFIGWYTDAALTSIWNFNSDIVLTELTLFAKWLTENVIYVATTGNDTTGDGRATNPFATIQKGITEADSAGLTEVWVAAGTYVTTSAIVLVDGISILGGYNSADWSRDIFAYATTIDSTPAGSPDRVFYASSLSDPNTSVDGFTINATMDNDGSYVFDVDSSSLIISNNIVNNNNSNWHSYHVSASNSTMYIRRNQFNCIGFGASYSGGIYLYSGGTAVITNNIIETEYSSAEAGGIYTDFSGTYDLTIRNNIIDAGYTSATTGAIGTKSTANFSSSTADITLRVDNNIITTDNTASDFYVLFSTSPNITIESFQNNAIYTPGSITFAGLYRNSEGTNDGGTDDTTYTDITSFETAFTEAAGNFMFTAADLFTDTVSKDFTFGVGADATITEGGLDGAGKAPAWSYSVDIDGTPRTGNSSTGWSIGVYEQD